jgi:hypothetical protein
MGETNLDGMTHEKWLTLTPAEKERARDMSGLCPQLKGLEGARVEVVDNDGTKRRFNVGRSTGWRPCHLEIHNARSIGGGAAMSSYRSVRVIRYNAKG